MKNILKVKFGKKDKQFTEKISSREKRQGFNRNDVEEGCKTTGYETRFRELCQEVIQI